jgi:hypothetical protein
LKILLCLLVLLVSCKDVNDPEALLKSFVKYRFSEGQTRDKVDEFLTDPLKSEIAGMTDEQFSYFADSSDLRMKNMRVVNSNCQETECYITYTLRFDTLKEGKKTTLTEIKKIALLKKLGKEWLISDVNNIKTFHDLKEPIAP